MKNNDKSIAALEGKSLLYDNRGENDKYIGKLWKHRKDQSQYRRKMMLKEKFIKQLGKKLTDDPDKTFGKSIISYHNVTVLSSI